MIIAIRTMPISEKYKHALEKEFYPPSHFYYFLKIYNVYFISVKPVL